MDTLFSHVNIVTMNEQMTLWQDAFVGVTDGKIAYMAKKPPEEQPKKIIDATGMVLMPGLINCHTHLPMYLLRGYADEDAVLTGVETRSSSPVRVKRGEDLQSNLRGLYPCGEGAGYAGGIMSAAVDGLRCAIALAARYGG